MARRTILKKKGNKSEKVKNKYSSKYVLMELLKCDECGKPCRRQVWSKNGDKMAVWRCECRLKNGEVALQKFTNTTRKGFTSRYYASYEQAREIANQKVVKGKYEELNSVIVTFILTM